jgi:hypothetical protein
MVIPHYITMATACVTIIAAASTEDASFNINNRGSVYMRVTERTNLNNKVPCVYFGMSSDIIEVVKIVSSKPLAWMTIGSCHINFLLNETIMLQQINTLPNGKPTFGCGMRVQDVPTEKEYIFPYKVQVNGIYRQNHQAQFQCVDQAHNNDVRIQMVCKYHLVSAPLRENMINKGLQQFTVDSKLVKGKQMDDGRIIFYINNYGLVNGLFMCGLKLDFVDKMQMYANGNLLFDGNLASFRHLLKCYADKTIYVPFDGNIEPNFETFHNAVYMSRWGTFSIIVTPVSGQNPVPIQNTIQVASIDSVMVSDDIVRPNTYVKRYIQTNTTTR